MTIIRFSIYFVLIFSTMMYVNLFFLMDRDLHNWKPVCDLINCHCQFQFLDDSFKWGFGYGNDFSNKLDCELDLPWFPKDRWPDPGFPAPPWRCILDLVPKIVNWLFFGFFWGQFLTNLSVSIVLYLGMYLHPHTWHCLPEHGISNLRKIFYTCVLKFCIWV
jgi:hypothetical protein